MNSPQPGPASAEPAFNLLDALWLPVRWLDGHTSEVGLLELFAHSRDIAGLAEPSPPSFVALHRMLLAITHRALTLRQGRWNDANRAGWYADGLPQQAFEQYLERWRNRFWLFHPTQPFMQVAALATAPQTQSVKPWTQVSLESAGGNNPVIFDHSIDETPSTVGAGVVLRSMMGCLQFTAGGPVKVLRKDGYGRKGALFDSAAILPTGRTLAQTLLLALHPAPRTTDEADEDKPAWERTPLQLADLTPNLTLPTGSNDRYTRQTRAILLQRRPCNLGISHLHACEGQDLLEDENAVDPMNSYRQGADKWVRLRFTEGRAAWRDLPALLPSPTGSGWRPASVLSWAQNLLDARGAWNDEVEVTVAGMAARQDKGLATRLECFVLPKGLMTAADTAAELRARLHQAEELHRDMRTLAGRMFALALPNSSSKEARAQARDATDAGPLSPTYFARVERGLPELLRQVAAADTEAAQAAWAATLHDAARQAWATAADLLGPSAAALRARALTENAFHALIRPLRQEAAGAGTKPAIASPQEARV